MDFLNAFFADTFSSSLTPAENLMCYICSLFTLGLIIRYIVDDLHELFFSFGGSLRPLLARFYRWLFKRS